MSVESLIVSPEILNTLNWAEVIASAPRPHCREYSRLFSDCAYTSPDFKGEIAEGTVAAWSLLASVTSAALRRDDPDSPFPANWLSSFSEEHLAVFEGLLPFVDDAEFKARLCDVIWLRLRRHQWARVGVRAYLDSAYALEDSEHWTHCAHRYARGVHLARSLGKKASEFAEALSEVEAVIIRLNGDDPLYLSASLMELLQHFNAGNVGELVALAEKAALRHEADFNWECAHRYREVQIEWHWMVNNQEAARDARIQAIELYVKEAQHLVAQENQPVRYLQACSILEKALRAYRDLGGEGAKERSQEIYALLREYQPKGVSSLPPLYVEVGPQGQAAKAQLREQMMSGIYDQTLLVALAHLARFPFLNGVAQSRDLIEKHLRRSPIALMFPFQAHTSRGMVTGRPASGPMTAEARLQIEVEHQWHHDANTLRSHYVEMLIRPAIEAINDEHCPQIGDLVALVHDTPFIPPGREFLFLRGLHLGLSGDFITAVHVLIPQIENALRVLLEAEGTMTSSFSRQETQNQFDLNRLFTTPELENKLIEILGFGESFHLKSVLVHHFGANLRNEIAHGTLGLGEFQGFYGPQCVFAWWLCLHLCFNSFLQRIETQVASEE